VGVLSYNLAVAALLIVVLSFRWLFKQTHIYVLLKTDGRGIRYQRKWFLAATLLFGAFAYGSLSMQPLKWNNAFILQDSFVPTSR
jgi:uncharacterized membrane protein YhhN